MLARVTTVHLHPDKIAEATAVYQNSVVPAVAAQQGCQGVYLLHDSSGAGMSITFWDSESNAQAYESSGAYRDQVSKFVAFFSAPPSLASYNVAAKA